MTCNHTEFKATVEVYLIGVANQSVDIKVNCAQCGAQAQFVGLSAGLSLSFPTCSVDATEARLPIQFPAVEAAH